jgi:hypothetical protein
MGSCFAENMGKRMEDLPFNLLNQAFGTQFNPLNILQSLRFDLPKSSEMYLLDDHFVHPDFHSQFIHKTKEGLLANITQKQKETESFLKETNAILITWGTAYYYQDNILKRPISNCHKQPSQRFTKQMNRVSEITQAYGEFLKNHANKHIILTVSPVRHTRDGMIENSVSKATLRLAAHEIVQAFPQQVSYFPAFEIMMDELRDYRFYEKDLIHPNELAIDYIWQKFKETYFSNELSAITIEWERIYKTLAHKPPITKINAQIIALDKVKAGLATLFPGLNYGKLMRQLDKEILSLKALLDA